MTYIIYGGLFLASILFFASTRLKQPNRNRLGHVGMLIMLASALLSLTLDDVSGFWAGK